MEASELIINAEQACTDLGRLGTALPRHLLFAQILEP